MHSAPDDYEVEIQNDNKIAANWLLWIEERKTDYLNRRIELIGSENHELQLAIPSNRNTGDSTQSTVLKLAAANDIEKWIRLINEIEEKLPWRKRVFLQLRRQYRFASGRQGWTAAVQYQYAQRIALILDTKPEEVWIDSRHTFKVWWNEIVDYTVRLACKRGLLSEKNIGKAS